ALPPLACPHDHRGRRPLAEPEARAALPAGVLSRPGRPELALERRAQRFPTAPTASDVVAYMNHGPRARLGREEMVEGHHAPRFRRRHGEALADVVERAVADPTDAILDGVECRQQKIAARGRLAGAP